MNSNPKTIESNLAQVLVKIVFWMFSTDVWVIVYFPMPFR